MNERVWWHFLVVPRNVDGQWRWMCWQAALWEIEPWWYKGMRQYENWKFIRWMDYDEAKAYHLIKNL